MSKTSELLSFLINRSETTEQWLQLLNARYSLDDYKTLTGELAADEAHYRALLIEARDSNAWGSLDADLERLSLRMHEPMTEDVEPMDALALSGQLGLVVNDTIEVLLKVVDFVSDAEVREAIKRIARVKAFTYVAVRRTHEELLIYA